MDEAKVLLASGTSDKSNTKLQLDEFLKFVLHDKDTPINVNLSLLSK